MCWMNFDLIWILIAVHLISPELLSLSPDSKCSGFSSCYAFPIHLVLISLRKSYEFFCFAIQYNRLLSIKHPHMQSTSVFSTRTIQIIIIDLYFWLFSLILGLFLVGLLRPYGPLYLSTLWKALRTSSSVSLETDERLPNHHTWVARVH